MDFTVINANLSDLTNPVDRSMESDRVEPISEELQPTELDADAIRNLGEKQLQGEDSQDTIQVILVNSFGLDLAGGSGDDVLYGSENFDVLHGENGRDRLEGFGGNDALYGGKHNDTLIGGKGNDILNGGVGYDRLMEAGNVNFTLTNTKLEGQGMDAVSRIESAYLTGGAGNNKIDASGATNIKTKLAGGAGNDILMGSQMSDSIYGGAGADMLHGEMGRDTLVGGGGADIFALESAMDADRVIDFQDGIDRFGLTHSLSFGDLDISNNSAGTAALITDLSNNGEVLAVVNQVDAADLTAVDFTMI